MKYFEVWAETSQRVYSDGTCDNDYEVAQDNIRKYFVDEMDEDGMTIATKEYAIDDFKKIAEEHPAPEWQNHMW